MSMKFKIDRVQPEEENRIDRLVYRAYGSYTHRFLMAVVNANPLVDFTNLLVNTELILPDRNWIFTQELANA